jgi:hypothetical protein
MRRFVIVRVAFLVAVILTGCASKGYYMTAVIDGQRWSLNDEGACGDRELSAEIQIEDILDLMTITNVDVTAFSYDARRVQQLSLYFAYLDRKPSIGIFMLGDKEIGDELLESPYIGAIALVDEKVIFGTDEEGGRGEIIITRVTREYIQGRFSFVATDGEGEAIVVKNGRFRAPIEK